MFDPMRIDLTQAPRTISFENPTGAAGMGGTVAGGRKGAPFRMIEPGERVTLADIEGPGTVRHVWCTVPPMRPDHLRALHHVHIVDAGGAERHMPSEL